MLRRTNFVLVGIAFVLVCSCMGFNVYLSIKDRSEGWIPVTRKCFWTLLLPKPPLYALRISRIDRNTCVWGPVDDDKNRERVCTWGGSAPPRPRDSDEDGYQHFFMDLRNPGEYRSVAVIEVKFGEVVELNPRRMLHPGKPWQTTFDYGPIPPLSDITSAECDALWGKSETIYPSVRTYKLMAFNNPEDGDYYFLDTVFVCGYLQKYRVRSSATMGAVALKRH